MSKPYKGPRGSAAVRTQRLAERFPLPEPPKQERFGHIGHVKKRKVLESLAGGATVAAAMRAADMHRNTFYEWLKSDQEFAKLVAHVEEAATQSMEDALWRTGVKGNVTAQIFWLVNRRPDRWQDVRKVIHDTALLSEAEIERRIAAIVGEEDVATAVRGAEAAFIEDHNGHPTLDRDGEGAENPGSGGGLVEATGDSTGGEDGTYADVT